MRMRRVHPRRVFCPCLRRARLHAAGVGSSWQRRNKGYRKLRLGYRKPVTTYRNPVLSLYPPLFNYLSPPFNYLFYMGTSNKSPKNDLLPRKGLILSAK